MNFKLHTKMLNKVDLLVKELNLREGVGIANKKYFNLANIELLETLVSIIDKFEKINLLFMSDKRDIESNDELRYLCKMQSWVIISKEMQLQQHLELSKTRLMVNNITMTDSEIKNKFDVDEEDMYLG